MNNITIHGRITRKPELKTTSGGIEVCNFAVAVNRPIAKGKEQIVDFFDCTAWRQTGAFVEKYFDTGDGIIVQGAMHSRKYTAKDGNERIAWTLDAERVEFAEKKTGAKPSATSDGFTPVDDADLPF